MKTKNKKLFIGIDPDLRVLNAAIITDDKKLHAVFVRRNKTGPGPIAVANAARMANLLIKDVIAFIVASPELKAGHEIHLVIEDQNLEHTKQLRQKGINVRDSDVLHCAQVAGCLMGAFSNLAHEIHLVQAIHWKSTKPKGIDQGRNYDYLGLECRCAGQVKNPKEGYCVPNCFPEIITWSAVKVNPGDFKDISDSVGLAAYGIKKGY